MFGIGYLKAGPTIYVIQFVNGKPVREGPGLSFYYFAPRTVLVQVPLSSVDVPFVFNEISADFQDVTIQGQLTYRVVDAKQLSKLLDFSVSPNGRYVSEDPRKLGERLVNLTQVLTSAITHSLKLREVLVAYESIVSQVLGGLKESPQVAMLGVEILGLSITSIKPTPDTGKALEAEAREALLRMADEAVYARRNAAVAQEQRIKESELNSEMAVEEKKRQIREAKMAADIAAEAQRAELLAQRVENERNEADARAYTLSAMIAPLKGVDWHTLMALSAGKVDPKLTIAMAFRDLADHAEKIGELNITPDLLGTLIEERKK
ncbi:MAG TPA: SPFH domain-containing protein [Tepidisphaeraceae bacterium]|jgi:regulator of protease activity HflC (stomatin/prohibitin superfamily)|nr:SPFH domain-containing protein [Tepidisphaeraceae bacterium]